MPTNEVSSKPLELQLLAGEQKATNEANMRVFLCGVPTQPENGTAPGTVPPNPLVPCVRTAVACSKGSRLPVKAKARRVSAGEARLSF